MPSHAVKVAHRLSKLTTLLLAGACAFVMTYTVTSYGTDLWQARVIQFKQPVIPWKFIKPADIARGVEAPADTHIMFQLPEEGFVSIQREILLGHKGKTVRYWGYCLPENDDPALVKKRTGLPGLLFLSEAERAARRSSSSAAASSFDPLNPPTPRQIQQAALGASKVPAKGVIRHQIDIFSPLMLCYLMTEKALPMGLDDDGDKLNQQVELFLRTNPKIVDTDGDGIWDGVEELTGTSPTLRDTDGDGLLDGIEDKNFNGVQEPGETSAETKDSDGDELCDGLCRFKIQKQEYYIGEDRNLNGKLDDKESNPLAKDTNTNGVDDFNEVFNCLRDGGKNC